MQIDLMVVVIIGNCYVISYYSSTVLYSRPFQWLLLKGGNPFDLGRIGCLSFKEGSACLHADYFFEHVGYTFVIKLSEFHPTFQGVKDMLLIAR